MVSSYQWKTVEISREHYSCNGGSKTEIKKNPLRQCMIKTKCLSRYNFTLNVISSST